ncbi:DUF6923 family protein [Chryseobacterium sp.]|uniref:DUF6923 family protein n=1 Tax=Chryseobacterium sp. TaxID=1871047 RepID=UPI002FC8DB26
MLFLFAFLLIGIGTNNLHAQDSDGDGIANNLDLDDDNDGILDTVECPSTYVVRPVVSSSVTANKLITYGTASQIIDGEGAGGTLEGPAPYWYTDVSNLPIAFSMNMQSSSTIDHIKLYAPWGFDEWIGNFRVELYNSSNTLLGTENLTTPDQYIGNPIFSFSTEYTNVTRIRFTILSSQGYSIVDPPRASLKEIVFLDLQQNCDTDGDGIPNHLDLDSDNDGCVDALEGSASILYSQLVNSAGTVAVGTGSTALNKNLCASGACVNAQGLPQLAPLPTGYSNTTGQGLDSSANSSLRDTQCATAFGCNTGLYLSQVNKLYTVDTSVNPMTYPLIGTSSVDYNSTAINPLNGIMYGIRTLNSNVLVAINPDGSSINLGPVTNLPTGVTYNAGEIDNAGNYYVKVNNNNQQLYKINLSTQTATLITLNTSIYVPDMAFNVTNGLLYAVNASPPTSGQLVSINPATKVVTPIGTSPGAGTFGAMFASSTGEIYGVENSGGFYQFNLTTGQRVKISDAPGSTGNDGAHCVTAPIVFSADLAISKNDGKVTYVPGTTNTYTVVVRNNGPYGVMGATVSDPVPAGIPAGNVSYSAPVVTGGATTSISSAQTGALNDVVNLPVGGTITYTVNVSIPISFTGDLVNVATVTSPTNSTDPILGDNSSTDTDYPAVCGISSTNPDSDSDGISDYCNLDDDNDGILDTAECPATNDRFISYTNTGDYQAYIDTSATNIQTANPSTAGAGLTRIISSPHNYMELSGIAATTEAQAITNNEYVEYSFTTNSKSSFLNNIGYYSTNYISTGEDTQYHFSAKISNNNFSTSTNILNDTNYDASTGTFIVPLANGAYLLSPNTTYKVRVYFYAVNGGASATIAHDDFNLRGFVECDTDGDGIPNRLDLDSDNDGCVDAFEGDENVTNVQLTTASGTVTVGIGSTASNQNLGNTVDVDGVPTVVNSGGSADVDSDQGQGIGSSTDATVNNCFCYKPAVVDAGNTYPTKHGITALGRAGAENENWPMVRQSAWTVLESKEKGFVVNRVNNTADLVNITNPVEGMMVYDNQANCLKIYTLKSGDTLMGWHCFTTPACPD